MKNNKINASGQNAIWDGPLDLDALPKGYGSSSGCKGMEISKAHCGCSSIKGPITQRAKQQSYDNSRCEIIRNKSSHHGSDND